MAASAASAKLSAPIDCSICLASISSEPSCEEEKPRSLPCHHTFHTECINEWLNVKQNCPLCRKDATTGDEQALSRIRINILEGRRIRQINLNEQTQLAGTARKVNNLFRQLFGPWKEANGVSTENSERSLVR